MRGQGLLIGNHQRQTSAFERQSCSTILDEHKTVAASENVVDATSAAETASNRRIVDLAHNCLQI